MATLNNWWIVKHYSVSQDAWVTRLCGRVTGHPTKLDGDDVITSAVEYLDVVAGKARTRSGTEYELKDPEPEWAAVLVAYAIPITNFNV